MARTRLQLDAERRAAAMRRSVGADFRALREDANVTLRQVGDLAGVDPSTISRIETAGFDASIESLSAVAAALGADLSIRVYPNSGPPIRDRFQAPIEEELVRRLHARWKVLPEVAVRSPVRGVVDLVLVDPAEPAVVAAEIQSEIHRVEQEVRWAGEKAASLPSSDAWSLLGVEPSRISRLLVLRSTRHNRAIVREFRRTFEAAYPADPRRALAALCGSEPWPGPTLLWATSSTSAAALLQRAPRGLARS